MEGGCGIICRSHSGSKGECGNMVHGPMGPQHTALIETFLLPTDAHNVKKHRVIKTF